MIIYNAQPTPFRSLYGDVSVYSRKAIVKHLPMLCKSIWIAAELGI
jgi:hypothetical protein